MQSHLKLVLFIATCATIAATNAIAGATVESNLVQLARARFTNALSRAEEQLFQAVTNGADAVCTNAFDTRLDPDTSESWEKDRVIRAACLAWLCTDPVASKMVTYRGVSIVGARIDGKLELRWAKIEFPLIIRSSAFTEVIVLEDAHLRGLDLSDTHIKGLDGDRLDVEKLVFLRDKFKTEGKISLIGAVINGDLDCEGGHFSNPGDIAFNADRANIKGSVHLRRGFETQGAVYLKGATIGGDLDCENGHFTNPHEEALNVCRTDIKGSVFLRAQVGGDIDLDRAFKAVGRVLFHEATIKASLDCRGGQFENGDSIALNADGVKVGADVSLGAKFKAEGGVRMVGATIDGDLDCSGGQFLSRGADALNSGGARIGGNVSLSEGFEASGKVSLTGAVIGGDLDCEDGHFVNRNGFALIAEGVEIKGHAYLRDGFEAEGKLSFLSAHVAHYFIWRGVASPEKAVMDLRSLKIGTLWDDTNSWPREGNVFLHGFVYDEIHDASPTDAKSRIDWIRRQPHDQFLPQPYEQLAAVLRKAGHEEEAAKVMIAKNEDHARDPHLPLHWWLWFHVFGKAVGFGYRPWYAFVISLLVIGIGTILFGLGYRNDLVTPTDEKARVTAATGARQFLESYPKFNPFVYSLEAFVPLVKLEMCSYWLPNANRGTQLRLRNVSFPQVGSLLRCYLWFHIIAGWILTTLWVGGLTGLVKT